MVSRKSNAQAEDHLLAHFFQAVIDHAFCAIETEFSRDNVTQISYLSSPKQESLYFPQTGTYCLWKIFTASAIPSADKSNCFSKSPAGLEWLNPSLTPMHMTFVESFSDTRWLTASPRLPMALCSSQVMTLPNFFAAASTSPYDSAMLF